MSELLPDVVAARLGGDMSSLSVVQRGRTVEARRFAVPEVRADEDGGVSMSGYATVYEFPYDVAGGPERGGWSEVIAEGACAKSVVERDDVRLLVNHEGLPLARTAAKTLTLASDAVGLRCDASLDRSSPLVASVLSAMERGDLDEMSFAFRVVRQEWDADYLERRITEVQLFDVSLVTYPANPATVAQVRDDVPAPSVRGLDLRMALAVRARLSI